MTTYRSTSQRVGRVLLIGFCTLVFAFLVLPILAVVPLSLNSGTFLVFPENGLSLRWYRVIAESPHWAHAFGNSFKIAVAPNLIRQDKRRAVKVYGSPWR